MSLSDRNIYLENIPIEEARQALASALHEVKADAPLSGKMLALHSALGRITAEPIWARLSSPHYHAAAMDGYAVKASDTVDATETRPLILTSQQAIEVNTGAPLPDGTNAVIMIEHTQQVSDGIQITAPVSPYKHVRMMGEDMVATELVVPANHKIRPVDMGAIAGCGHHQVSVRKKPHVVIIPTGNELISADSEPQAGQIIEYNSLVLAAQIEEAGGTVSILPIQPDDIDTLQTALQDALDEKPQLVLILSGSSAGSKDFTAAVIKAMGHILVHGVAVRPGHPVIMGMVDNIPVIGVPGYPVSAALTGELFIEPLLANWLGQQAEINTRSRIKATITRKVTSPTGDDDFVRVTVAKVGDNLLATPLSRGAGVITSLVRADGLAHIPRFSEGLNMRAEVEILLYRSLHEIEATVMAIGSHDPMLDLLGQHLATQFHGNRLTSANVGSMGGIVALKRGETHIAGMHLLDEASGEYNLPYLQKQLPNVALQVVTFAHREQGLIVQKGNPHNIKSLDDLPRLRYVNRQRGAGTRLLLDYELNQRAIAPDSIIGYDREEYTHMAVAAAVATKIADCGLGVRSAAIALDLDFVSVGWERYDIVIPQAHQNHAGVKNLLTTLNSEPFKMALATQDGYDIRETGTLQYES
ncbi:MAG: molybdopterin biosynthesis protein [Anaerolineae bacterium]|nr:molybdopterin biosynthesis protein [Anaerolineae bacterium]